MLDSTIFNKWLLRSPWGVCVSVLAREREMLYSMGHFFWPDQKRAHTTCIASAFVGTQSYGHNQWQNLVSAWEANFSGQFFSIKECKLSLDISWPWQDCANQGNYRCGVLWMGMLYDLSSRKKLNAENEEEKFPCMVLGKMVEEWLTLS